MGGCGHLLIQWIGNKEHSNTLDYIGPGPAHSEIEGSPAFDDGSVHLDAPIHQAERSAAVPAVETAFVHAHIHNRREPSAVARREASLVEIHILNHIGIER